MPQVLSLHFCILQANKLEVRRPGNKSHTIALHYRNRLVVLLPRLQRF